MKHSRRLKRSAAVAFVGLLVVGAAAASAQGPSGRGARSFLWKVQAGDRVMYLAGSVHALTADVYPLNPAFERAFVASDMLVEEIDLDRGDIATLGPTLLAKGVYQDGRTFDSAVSPETAALVAQRLKPPMVPELIRPMKPWMVMLMLTVMQMQDAGLDANLGLDRYFYDKAKEAGKTIVGLETAESQIDRFDTMPDSLQEQLLRSALDELDSQGKELNAILAAWQRGEAAALDETLLGAFKKYPAAYQSLIVERNNNWMPQIEQCLARPTPCLVVVGAAHLVGTDGLLAMLERRGYRLEQQ